MSELQNKIIKKVDLKPEPWHRNNGWYGHIVHFEDGTKGEIFECTEANPPWLQVGKNLVYVTEPNKYIDKPFIVTVEKVEQKKREASQPEPYSPQNNSASRFQKKGSGGGYRGGYGGRFEDSPDIWIMKQKFISILKMYEVLMPLVVKGDIKYADIQSEVTKHLEYTIKKSGMNEPLPAKQQSYVAPAPARTNPENHCTAPIPVAKKDPKDDRLLHTNREVEPEPNLNPEEYSQQEPPTLFEDDKGMANDPVPADLMEKISKCKSKAKLLSLQKGLSEAEINNKKVMDAFLKQKRELMKK